MGGGAAPLNVSTLGGFNSFWYNSFSYNSFWYNSFSYNSFSYNFFFVQFPFVSLVPHILMVYVQAYSPFLGSIFVQIANCLCIYLPTSSTLLCPGPGHCGRGHSVFPQDVVRPLPLVCVGCAAGQHPGARCQQDRCRCWVGVTSEDSQCGALSCCVVRKVVEVLVLWGKWLRCRCCWESG